MGEIDEESQRLLAATEGALWAGIAQARAGNRWLTSQRPCRPMWKRASSAVVREYTGHGVGRRMHEEPQVLNYRACRAPAEAHVCKRE